MFEQYSQESRRVIFFARYESSCLASPTIETEHLLLGLMRETRSMFERTLSVQGHTLAMIRQQIEARSAAAKGEAKLSTSVDLPMGVNARIALQHAEEEAAAMQDQRVRPAHLLLALLRDDEPVSQILRDFGVVYDVVRQQMAAEPAEHRRPGPLAASLTSTAFRRWTLLLRAQALALVALKRAATPL